MQLSWDIYCVIYNILRYSIWQREPQAWFSMRAGSSSSLDTLVCSPLAVVDGWPASVSVTFFCLHVFFCSSFDLTVLLLDLSGVGAPPCPSSSSHHATRPPAAPATQPQLHLGPSVSHPPASPLKPQLTLRWATIPLQLTPSLSPHLCLPLQCPCRAAPQLHPLTAAWAWDSYLCPALELVE